MSGLDRLGTARNGSYVGVDLEDVDAGSTYTRPSQYSRLSDISLLKYHNSRRTRKVVVGASARLQRILSKDFWHQVPPQTKTFFGEAYADLKAIGWGHYGWRFCTVFVPILVVIGLTLILPVITSRKLYAVNDACRPDSGFYVGYGDYNIWDLSGFFQITLGFGDFSFQNAKTIDVGWDVRVCCYRC